MDRKADLKLTSSKTPESANLVKKDGRLRDSVPSKRPPLVDKVMDWRPHVQDNSEVDKRFEEVAVDKKFEPLKFQQMPIQMEPQVRHVNQATIESSNNKQSRILLEKSAPVDEVSMMVSKGKSISKNYLSLLEGYPLFDSPYPPPVLDGHTCR